MYTKTAWAPHQLISSDKLNNIENGVYSNSIGHTKLPVVLLSGDVTDLNNGKESTLSFCFNDGNQEINGYAQVKWQGDSSLLWNKKNYKITLYSDSALTSPLNIIAKSGWLSCNTYNLKANYIDAVQARNLTNAEIAREMAIDRIQYYSTSDVNAPHNTTNPDLTNYYQTQSFGQMQGFPVEVYINNADNGLYTFNTKKNKVIFNMDASNDKHIAIEYSNNKGDTQNGLLFVNSDTLDGTYFDLITPQNVTTDITNAFNAFLSFVNSSSDTDFISGAYNNIDINSAIDNYILATFLDIQDMEDKSILYLTYDAKYWIPIPYDLDSGEGLHWDASLTDNIQEDCTITQNHLTQRIVSNFNSRIVSRYKYLRGSILSLDNIMKLFSQFIGQINTAYYQNDWKIWNIPKTTDNTLQYIQYFLINRAEYVDGLLYK